MSYASALSKPSKSSVFANSHAFSKERLLENLFTKLSPSAGEKGLHDILKALYRAKPECFIICGDLHNSRDGKDTYLSVKVYTSNTFYYNIHIYGIMRGCTFTVLRTESYLFCDAAPKTFICEFNSNKDLDEPAEHKIW
jgi:hypothetical protein